jgi:hypothetical protein
VQQRPIASVKTKLLDSDVHPVISTNEYVGKSTAMDGIPDRSDVDAGDEEGSGEDIAVRGELDEKVQGVTIELVA